MYQRTYYMDKRTGTFADPLAAYGLAAVLDRLLAHGLGERGDVMLMDTGSCYTVRLGHPVEEVWLEEDIYFDLLPFILTGTSRRYMPEGMHPVVDYDAQRERRATYFEMRRKLPSELRRRDAPDDHPAIQAMNQYKPHQHWPVWAAVNQMQAIWAYSKLAAWWYENRKHAGHLLRLILHLCHVHPNPVDETLARWKEVQKRLDLTGDDKVTTVQVTNPAAGKGANRSKADDVTVGTLDEFWLLELLKMAGLYRAGLPRRVRSPSGGRSSSNDRKVYVLLPLELELGEHEKVFARFRETLYGSSAIKMDVLAALRYTRTFLQYCDANRGSSLATRLFGRGPQHFVAGFGVTFYKDLGQAVAVLNQSQVNLPGWIQAETSADVRDYLDALEEHDRVVRNLDEGQGEGYELLDLYRDFLSARDLTPFYEFTGRYAGYLMSQMERRQWAPQFTTTNLRRVIMGTDRKLKPILDSVGFQHVAEAIRRSTVIPQYRKAQDDRLYDVRYGLGQELKRKANYDDEFVQVLSDFMQSYNQENAQIAESRGVQYRRNLTTDDIVQVVELVDEYGAKTVGNLLVAYGYAREPREQETEAGEEVSRTADSQEIAD